MNTLTLALTVSVGAAVALFVLFYGILMPRHPTVKPKAQVAQGLPSRGKRVSKFPGIQARLDAAQMEIRAEVFVKQCAIQGGLLGVGMFALVGAVILVPIGIGAGILFTWSKLEQERDVKNIKYLKQLASACDIVTNAYSVRPSLVRALGSAAEFTASPLREDFEQMVVGLRQGEFEETLRALADKRRSIIFDMVANALTRAKDESGQVKDIMEKLAATTRQSVLAFEDAVSMQVNARSSIRWGTYGPWLVFAVFRLLTLFTVQPGKDNAFAAANSFFGTLPGNIVVAIAAMASIGLYVQGYRLSQRGLVVKRVSSMEANALRSGQVVRPVRKEGEQAEESGARAGRWSPAGGSAPVQIPISPEG